MSETIALRTKEEIEERVNTITLIIGQLNQSIKCGKRPLIQDVINRSILEGYLNCLNWLMCNNNTQDIVDMQMTDHLFRTLQKGPVN
ncbi:hypothetical protein [Acinetobacter sp.]|uniref:hypothetical protein n=1 Tax=Acinetobacter sp. TaxID=472 RepID=UPI003CFC35A1